MLWQIYPEKEEFKNEKLGDFNRYLQESVEWENTEEYTKLLTDFNNTAKEKGTSSKTFFETYEIFTPIFTSFAQKLHKEADLVPKVLDWLHEKTSRV